MKEGELQAGLTYLFRGYWGEYRGKKQFCFSSCGIAQPVGKRGTVAYLQRGPGIGAKRAEQLWAKYGQDALEAVRERPEEVAAAVAGLSLERAKEAAAYFKAHKDREAVERDLEEIGLTRKQQEAAIEKWGAKAGQVIRENAFRLMTLHGIGFGKADKLFLSLGGDPAAVERLGWCAWNALHREREGNTWCKPLICMSAIGQSVSGVDFSPTAGLNFAVEKRIICHRKDPQGRNWLAEDGRAEAEGKLASAVHRAIVEGE